MANVYWHGDGGNWSDFTNHWFNATDGGGGSHGAAPGADDNAIFDANSFDNPAQVVTVDATANCLDLDWTGATNTPTLAQGAFTINVFGSLTTIAAMVWTASVDLELEGVGNHTITTNGLTYPQGLRCFGSLVSTGVYTLQDALTCVGNIYLRAMTLNTNNQTVTCAIVYDNGQVTARVLTLGSSTINCTQWSFVATGFTLTANTSTINVSGTGAFAGGGITTYNIVNLNGTAHTISGDNTFATLTRNGTATKTDTITLTSGATLTCTTFAMIGNSATNRLLVQSSTLGTAATVTATNWTGADNFDLMDITATNAVDLSGVSSGDCGGNTGITFTTAAAQISNATGNWSTAATWQDGVGTDRVPLPQDDVSCSHNVTVDMPRIGKSITFTGTPTVSLSNDYSLYGSLVLASGMTYTHNDKYPYFRGRGAYTLTTNGINIARIYMTAPNGTLTTVGTTTGSSTFSLDNGTLTFGGDVTCTQFQSINSNIRTLNLGNGVITVDLANASVSKWRITSTNLIFNAGNSTIIFTNSSTNAQSFQGGDLTYNHVRVEGAGAYTLTITGDNTFEKLRNDSSAAVKTILLTPASTQTIRNLQVFSSAANVAVFNTGGAAATIQKHRGYCELNHVNLTSIVAGEKYKYYAGNNSTDGTGNTNWIFTHKARGVE